MASGKLKNTEQYLHGKKRDLFPGIKLPLEDARACALDDGCEILWEISNHAYRKFTGLVRGFPTEPSCLQLVKWHTVSIWASLGVGLATTPPAGGDSADPDPTKRPSTEFRRPPVLQSILHHRPLHWSNDALLDQDSWFGSVLKRVLRVPFWT